MPGKILGLDISEDSIAAVQVKSGLKGYQITSCAVVTVEPDEGFGPAMKGLIDKMDLGSDACFASIPPEHISYRNLQMPFKAPKKIRQTLPFEIETMVPCPIDDLVVDFTINTRSDQSDILAVSAEKSYISEYLKELQTCGIDPDVLDNRCGPIISRLLEQEGTPDHGLFLEIGKKRITMGIYLKRRIALIRAFGINNSSITHTQTPEQTESCFKSFCETVQNTIHSFAWQGIRPARPEKIFFTGSGAVYPQADSLLTRFLDIPAEKIDLSKDKHVNMDENISRVWNPALMDGALALALRDTKQGQGFNFRRDEFEIEKRYSGFKKGLRKIAIILMIVFAFLAADMGVDYYLLKKRYVTLDQEITDIFKQTFPNVKRIVDPVQQTKVKINEIKALSASTPGINPNGTALDLLMDISQRIPKSLDVDVTRMGIDQETVRISGKTDTYSAVDRIKNALEPSTYFSSITISSTNLDRTGKHVKFEMKLQRAR